MRSMTGFGVGDAVLSGSPGRSGSAKVSIEIRSVNHRFLDVRVRAPTQLPDLANVVELLAREALQRGRFDVAIRIDESVLGELVIDHARAAAVFRALTRLRDELSPGADVPLSLLGAVPNLFVPSIERDGEALRSAITVAFGRALVSLEEMRAREGVALAADLRQRLANIRRSSAVITERRPLAGQAYEKRLRERAERLALAVDAAFDQGRLEQELAIFADRVDISEELTRLDGHCDHFESLVASPEGVGRRLEFLLQEMAREANTIGSKSQDLVIAHTVVELKAEIERMREQVQNVA